MRHWAFALFLTLLAIVRLPADYTLRTQELIGNVDYLHGRADRGRKPRRQAGYRCLAGAAHRLA
ncbi:MAG: hypothetical protein U5J83_03590 [Bryobacterales bacterium]|nr:hypothetical protein [Bryobacterales bacterium]